VWRGQPKNRKSDFLLCCIEEKRIIYSLGLEGKAGRIELAAIVLLIPQKFSD
jgi:hypothetical protein